MVIDDNGCLWSWSQTSLLPLIFPPRTLMSTQKTWLYQHSCQQKFGFKSIQSVIFTHKDKTYSPCHEDVKVIVWPGWVFATG